MEREKKLVNLTPHKINILTENEKIIEVEPSGVIVRIDEEIRFDEIIDGITFIEKRLTNIENLTKEIEDGTLYIVSLVVKNTEKLKNDKRFVAPDTGATAVRESGKIVAVRNLISVIK